MKSFSHGEGAGRTGVVTRFIKGLFKKARQFLTSVLAYGVQRLKLYGDGLLQALKKLVE